MENKNIIIIAIILAALMVGVGWYYANHTPPETEPAAISETPGQEEPEETEEGPSEQVVTEQDIVLGNPEAPVTIIEYSSYFCGHCVRFAQTTFQEIKENYIKEGKVKFILRVFPPLELGQATLCAQDQDKFWEYSDYLFGHSQEIQAIEDLKKFAGDLGLDGDKFWQCFESKKYEEQAKSWYEQGQEAGVTGTPTFFINGEQLVGAQPYETFVEAIERALEQ